MLHYPDIRRPSTVINKCDNFMNSIQRGDILVIPSHGSQFITFAVAGEYFEDESKTVALEKLVINRLKDKDIDIHEVSCPYKKDVTLHC